MYPGKNSGGELNGGMLDQKINLPKGSSAMEMVESGMTLDDQIALARQRLQEIKYKPNLTAKELEEVEDLVRSLEARKRSETI